MDERTIENISKQVGKRFPEITSKNPTVKTQKSGKGEEARYVLTYKGRTQLPNGREMKQVVRVVADGSGRILKMSASK